MSILEILENLDSDEATINQAAYVELKGECEGSWMWGPLGILGGNGNLIIKGVTLEIVCDENDHPVLYERIG